MVGLKRKNNLLEAIETAKKIQDQVAEAAKGNDMVVPLDKKDTVSVEEAVISQSYEIAALVSLLEKKGLLTRVEIIEEVKELKDSEA